MRTAIIFALLLCCISSLCPSCEFSEVDLGFPHKVSFPKEGGEMIITGGECNPGQAMKGTYFFSTTNKLMS